MASFIFPGFAGQLFDVGGGDGEERGISSVIPLCSDYRQS